MGKLVGNFRLASFSCHSVDLVHVKYFDQVSGVAFDSYWSSPNANDNGETIMYRFGSVGQVLEKYVFISCFFVALACCLKCN